MGLSRTVEYAIRATLKLALSQNGQPVACSELAAQSGMPERFLLQILRNLVTHGILRSTRGVTGGYRLHRLPEHISLLDIVEAVEGPVHDVSSGHQGMLEGAELRVRETLNGIAEFTRSELSRLTFAQLVEAAAAQNHKPEMN